MWSNAIEPGLAVKPKRAAESPAVGFGTLGDSETK
jgi:hypothetical protein